MFPRSRNIGTYRLSQDHLELFFSCVRQRGGWNNTHSAAQFRYAYRSLLVNADIQAPATTNITLDMERISTLQHQGMTRTAEEDEEPQSFNPLELVIPDDDYGVPYGLSKFSAEAVKFIGASLTKVVAKLITCSMCLDLLMQNDATSVVIYLKEDLVMPSTFVHHLINCAEFVFLLDVNAPEKVSVQHLTLKAFRYFTDKHETSLSDIPHF